MIREFHPVRLIVLLVFLFPVATAPALAQDKSHWGVGGSFTPKWTGQKSLTDLLVVEAEGTVEGSQFTIGIVRGRTLGGDWGVSFVRTAYKDELTLAEVGDCGGGPVVCTYTNTYVFHNVFLNGVEVHKSIPFVTIKQRVQIGINLAGGIAGVKGDVEQKYESTVKVPNQPPTTISDVFTGPANEFLYKYQPLMKVELEGGVILAPGLKLKVAGGLNYVGLGVRVGGIYLIGAK